MSSRLMSPRKRRQAPQLTPLPGPGQAPQSRRQAQPSAPNPYYGVDSTAPPAAQQLDPNKAFWGGYAGDVINMLGQHDYSAFQTGPAQKRYAEMYNQGRTKEQIDYNTMMYNRENQQFERDIKQKAQDEREWQKKMKAKSYTDAFRAGDYEGTMAQWMDMTDADRSKVSLPDDLANVDRKNVQSVFTGENGNKMAVLRDGTILDLEVKASPSKTEIVTDRGGVAYVKQTLPGGEVTMTPLSEYQSTYRQQQLAGEKTAEKTAELTAKSSVEMKGKLLNNIDSLEKQIGQLERLREIVADGPATGRIAQTANMWNSEVQALEGMLLAGAWNKVIDMKDAGMTFGNFTDTEFTRIAKTLGEIGDKREANVAKIDNAIRELKIGYNLFFDRYEDPAGFWRQRERKFGGGKASGTRDKFNKMKTGD